MGQVLFDTLDDWAEGFVTSVDAESLPGNASPWMRNAALAGASLGSAFVEKRRGCSVMNTVPISGRGAVIGQLAFFRRTGNATTQFHLLVSDSGRLDVLSPLKVLTNISTGLTPGSYYPDFATANNLAFVVNGQDQKKTDGTTLFSFGITAPLTAPTLSVGAAGNHNGTYEGRVTFYNENTLQESSAGPTSTPVVITNDQIDWTAIPVSADTQVTARKLYLRNTATQANFYFVATLAGNVATTATTNVLDSALLTIGPNTTENDPPPSGLTVVEGHRGRLFASDGVDLYYSKVSPLVESFDPEAVEAVAPDNGQLITALHSAHDLLLIFKSRSLYALYGDDPQGWVVRLVDANIGCTSPRSVLTVEGVTYWWSEQGAYAWDGAGPPQAIALERIAATVDADHLNPAQRALIVAGEDPLRQRLLFSVPAVGQTRNTLLLPYNYRLKRWEGEWDPLDVASLGVAYDAYNQPWLFLGGYDGQVFKWWDSDADAIHTGTTSGTFVAVGTSVTTITDLTAAFDTTDGGGGGSGGGLVGRKVTILTTAGAPVGSSRQTVNNNTATAVTLNTAVVGLTNGATYVYIVGGPDFQLSTPWRHFSTPFHKKRFEFLHTQALASGSGVEIFADIAFNYDSANTTTKTLTFTGPGSVWDEASWDMAFWGGDAVGNLRTRVGKTGRIYQVTYRNPYPSQLVALARIGMQAELLTTKR